MSKTERDQDTKTNPRSAAAMRPTQAEHPIPIATLALDSGALRQAMVEALRDPRVIEQLAAALSALGAATGGVPRFMSEKEYARHACISVRTLGYARQKMTENQHFSRSGRRVRYHVKEADEFMAKSKAIQTEPRADDAADLEALAHREVGKRRLKASGSEGK